MHNVFAPAINTAKGTGPIREPLCLVIAVMSNHSDHKCKQHTCLHLRALPFLSQWWRAELIKEKIIHEWRITGSSRFNHPFDCTVFLKMFPSLPLPFLQPHFFAVLFFYPYQIPGPCFEPESSFREALMGSCLRRNWKLFLKFRP